MKRIKPFEGEGSIVYLVASPIGNIEDISSRAIRILKESDFIYCEDTRNTSTLLKRLNINFNNKLYSLYSQNEDSVSINLIEKLKKEDLVVSYLSDAGMPTVSDPGFVLISNCIKNGIKTSILPGPSASLAALSMSGIDSSSFSFHGFISPKEGPAISYLTAIKNNPETLIFFETSKRIANFISYLYKSLGNRNICICKEITKIHEEYIRGSLEEIINEDLSFIKGELVIVVEGNNVTENEDISIEKTITPVIVSLKKSKVSNKSILLALLELYPNKKNFLFNLIEKL